MNIFASLELLSTARLVLEFDQFCKEEDEALLICARPMIDQGPDPAF
jgi:hypothetical protein